MNNKILTKMEEKQIFDSVLKEIFDSQEELSEEAPVDDQEQGEMDDEEERTLEDQLDDLDTIGGVLKDTYYAAIKALISGGAIDGSDDIENVVDDIKNNPRKSSMEIAKALKAHPRTQNYIADIAKAYAFFNRHGKSGGEGEGDGGDGGEAGTVGKDVPLSIFKRQRDQPALKSARGAWEMPLTSYLKKKMQLSDRSVQRIAQNVGKALKGKGLNIAEGKVHSIVSQIIEGRASRGELGSTREGDVISTLEKNLDSLKTKREVLLFRTKIERGEAPKGVGQVLNIDGSRSNLEDNGTWVEKAQGWFLRYGGKKVIDDKLKSLQSGDDLKLRRSQRHGGLIGHIMYSYALRQGKKDPEFMDKFVKDPKGRETILKSINKMLRRQMRRRGIADADIKNYLKEITEIMYTEMLTEDIIEEFNKHLNA